MRKVFFATLFILLGIGLIIIYVTVIKRFSVEVYESQDNSTSEEKTVHFIHWGYFAPEIFKKFSEKHPSIKVEYEQVNEENYSQALKYRLAIGDGLDVIGVMPNDYENFIRNHYLLDLSGKPFLNCYPPEIRKAVTNLSPTSNREFAVAYQSWILGVWYNKILFNKYNLKVPQNYADFMNVCAVFKSNGIAPLVIGARDEWTSSFIYLLRLPNVLEKDSRWFEKVNLNQVQWKDPDVRQCFSEVAGFIKKGYLKDDSYNLTYHQAFMEFANSRAAMIIMKDLSLNLVTPDLERVCEPGVFPIPYNPPGTRPKVPGNKADLLMGINVESKNKREAELFLSYLSSSEAAQIYVNTAMAKPNIRGVNMGGLKYYDLWEPLHKMPQISSGIIEMKNDVRKVYNTTAKQQLIDSAMTGEVLNKLQKAQQNSPN